MLYYISERDMSVEQKNDEFYMTLTPTITSSLTRTNYEKVMSDFETQLRKPTKLNPNFNWCATLMNTFISIHLSLVKSAKYSNYWFQYVWGEQKRLAAIPVFSEKHLVISDGDHFQEFRNVFNNNSKNIGNDYSLAKTSIPMTILTDDNDEKMLLTFTNDIPVKSVIGFRMDSGFAKRFLGVTDDEFKMQTIRRNLFHIEVDNKRIHIPTNVIENTHQNYVNVIFTNLTSVIKKGTTATCVRKIIKNVIDDEINRRVDVEVSIIASNKLSGTTGQIIRRVTENASDVNTEVDESKQDMFLPIQIKEFSYIHCRLLHHVNKQPLKYKYETIVGRPLLVIKITPDEHDC